jgi:hypothetical protein
MRAHGDGAGWDSAVTASKYCRTGDRTGQLGRVVARHAAECSAPTGEIPQTPLSGDGGPLKTSVFSEIPAFLAGAGLALGSSGYHVFRAALFSILLTLAVGQNASLLCRVWCPNTTSAACLHQDSTTSPSLSAQDNCRTDVGAAVAFVREDARRTAAAPDAQNALAVPRFRLALSHTDLGSGFESRRLLFQERPLVIALRV